MKTLGVLQADLPAHTEIDFYETDESYWRTFWPNAPQDGGASHGSSSLP